eukprot:1996507-Rhodomonas_salina.2
MAKCAPDTAMASCSLRLIASIPPDMLLARRVSERPRHAASALGRGASGRGGQQARGFAR